MKHSRLKSVSVNCILQLIDRFREKYLVLINWTLRKHCFKNKWFLDRVSTNEVELQYQSRNFVLLLTFQQITIHFFCQLCILCCHWMKSFNVVRLYIKGAFTSDFFFFFLGGGVFLTYPYPSYDQMLYYISLFIKISCSLTYLPT